MCGTHELEVVKKPGNGKSPSPGVIPIELALKDVINRLQFMARTSKWE